MKIRLSFCFLAFLHYLCIASILYMLSKMMKKRTIAAVVLAGSMAFALSSCGRGNKNVEAPVSDSPAQVEDEAGLSGEENNLPAGNAGEETTARPDSLAAAQVSGEEEAE